MKAQDPEFLARLKRGDEAAFKELFDLYYRPLTLFGLRYIDDVEEVKEVVQEFFIRFWSRHEDLDIRFSLKPYLYRGVKNACLNYLESARVARHQLREYSSPQVTHSNALEHMLAAEQEELLMRAIDALPEKCRRIFMMSRYDKLSNQAIADGLSLSVKTVESQITIALKRLREFIVGLLLVLFSF